MKVTKAIDDGKVMHAVCEKVDPFGLIIHPEVMNLSIKHNDFY
jgi:hypothetical protein